MMNDTYFPRMTNGKKSQLPLLSYLELASSSLYWVGNKIMQCKISSNWYCISFKNYPKALYTLELFYGTTPLGSFARKLIDLPDISGQLIKPHSFSRSLLG